MYKIRPIDTDTNTGRYQCAYISTLERERMLGYPDGYVSDARKLLKTECVALLDAID